MSGRTGILVLNLGTPDDPSVGSVRRYLREFLSDPLVLDIHPLARFALVQFVIAPFRSFRSAEAYASIWTTEGSPLLVHTRRFADALDAELEGLPVALAMRYGRPTVEAALTELEAAGCERVCVFPLYPQYAQSSTESSLVAVRRAARGRFRLVEIESFHDDAGFLDALAEIARGPLAAFRPDHVLLSYHGLPERHIEKLDESGRCLAADFGCCERIEERNRLCYRAHCVATSTGLVARLGLAPGTATTCFQSRLGRERWILPHTDVLVEELAAAGKKRLAVLCPSFTADCLETLEEIGIRAKESFVAAGGEDLLLVPSLNDDPRWVAAAAKLVRDAVAG